MAIERPVAGNIVIIGAAAIAVVVVLLGVLNWDNLLGRPTSDTAPVTMSQPASPNPAAGTPVPSASQTAAQQAAAPASAAPPPAPTPAAAAAPPPATGEAIAPSFDVVRVEPNGDSVIAGRSAPGATIELLRNDQVHARAVADNSGLFAFTPPPLPSGSHKIVLQSIAPDGKRQRSKESVTVEINGSTRPLVALTAPDKPTVVLSNPEPAPPAKAAEAAPAPSPAPQQQASAGPNGNAPATPPPSTSTPRADIKIMSVESEEGKLYVSGEAAPGATVRLYLNESFIAPGGAGGDGKLSFAIASGVKAGEYRVRLDEVDPVSGQVKSRAEVGYSVPALVAEAAPPAQNGAAAPAAGSPSVPSAPASPGRMAAAPALPPELPPNTVVIPNIDTAIVSRGDSLWRISQRIYGRGYRYTVIYGANQTQIRNPNLIYPGQIFVLPNNDAQNTN